MKANGGHAALVSGGFTAFTGAVAAHLGFDENRANTLIIEDGKLTGTVGDPILANRPRSTRWNRSQHGWAFRRRT